MKTRASALRMVRGVNLVCVSATRSPSCSSGHTCSPWSSAALQTCYQVCSMGTLGGTMGGGGFVLRLGASREITRERRKT